MNPMEEWNSTTTAEGTEMPTAVSADMPEELPGAVNEPNPATLLGLDAQVEMSAAPRRGIPQSFIVICFVVALAAGSLLIMRKAGAINLVQTVMAQELLIEEALARMQTAQEDMDGDSDSALASMFNNADDVVQLFLDDPTSRQVPLENVAKNPFKFVQMAGESHDTGPEHADQAAAGRMQLQQKQQRQRVLHDELSRLTLQTVMTGSFPMAMISDQVVREGDRVGSFMIASIKPRAIELVAEGNTYTLWMNESN